MEVGMFQGMEYLLSYLVEEIKGLYRAYLVPQQGFVSAEIGNV